MRRTARTACRNEKEFAVLEELRGKPGLLKCHGIGCAHQRKPTFWSPLPPTAPRAPRAGQRLGTLDTGNYEWHTPASVGFGSRKPMLVLENAHACSLPTCQSGVLGTLSHSLDTGIFQGRDYYHPMKRSPQKQSPRGAVTCP